MTAKEIIYGYCRSVFNGKKGNKIFPNIFYGTYEADILEITKSGYVTEYEVKISRSDFFADAKKRIGKSEFDFSYKKIELATGQRVNYFYYVVPEGLISKDELPIYAGLAYPKIKTTRYFSAKKGYYDKEELIFQIIVQAPCLSKEKISPERLIKCLESTYYRFHNLVK